jgi:HEAT repeats
MMAQIFLHRDEAEDGDLPPVCVCCGRRAERWDTQRFKWHPWWVNNPLWLLFMTKRMNATLPYCADHPRFLQGPAAAHIANDGITLRRVDAEFVAAVEAYRQRPRRRREAAESYGRDRRERIEPRPRRERREQPRRQAGSSAGCVLGILAIVGAAFVLLVSVGAIGFALMLPLFQVRRAPAPAPFIPPIAPPVVRADVPRLRQVTALVVGHGAGFPADMPWAALVAFDPQVQAVQAEAERLNQNLADLKSPSAITASDAAKKLANTALVDERREEVSKALEPLLGRPQPYVREAAAQALAVWGTGDNVPALIKMLETDHFPIGKSAAMDALASLKDPRAAEPVAKLLTHPFDRTKARQTLELLGPAAERAVLPYVQHADAGVRVEACRLLGVIGTAVSTPALENAAADPNRAVAEAAALALAAVQARQK